MDFITLLLVIIAAMLAGMEGVLDQFQFHQPIVACTLIGLATGNVEMGILLGGSLQFIAVGWMNIGAAIAPDRSDGFCCQCDPSYLPRCTVFKKGLH